MDDRPIDSLVKEAQGGDRAATQQIYELFAPRIYNFLLRMLESREEAEDITQQTFLIVIRQLPGLRDASQLESWIYRIARNEVYQRFRRKRIAQLDAEPIEAYEDSNLLVEQRPDANPEKLLLNQELREVLHSKLLSLPLRLREVFVLAVVQGMSYKSISEISGRSILSVKTDIYRARLSIKRKLHKYLGSRPGAKSETE